MKLILGHATRSVNDLASEAFLGGTCPDEQMPLRKGAVAGLPPKKTELRVEARSC
ncbi:MAG: hypothetical protein ACLP1Y_05670 [Candidatus Acidiferrales bacterium]